MRPFFIVLLLSISHLAGATVPAPTNHCATTNIQFAFTGEQKIGIVLNALLLVGFLVFLAVVE